MTAESCAHVPEVRLPAKVSSRGHQRFRHWELLQGNWIMWGTIYLIQTYWVTYTIIDRPGIPRPRGQHTWSMHPCVGYPWGRVYVVSLRPYRALCCPWGRTRRRQHTVTKFCRLSPCFLFLKRCTFESPLGCFWVWVRLSKCLWNNRSAEANHIINHHVSGVLNFQIYKRQHCLGLKNNDNTAWYRSFAVMGNTLCYGQYPLISNYWILVTW